jgi:hypothetical protein
MMFYLRRWLFRFRGFVGGPRQLDSFDGRIDDMGQMSSLDKTHAEFTIREREHNLAVVPDKDFQDFHCTSLSPRDRERNKPFIPVLAGGKP